MADITGPGMYRERRREEKPSEAQLYHRMTKETVEVFHPESKADPGGAYGTEYGSAMERAKNRLFMLRDKNFKPYRSYEHLKNPSAPPTEERPPDKPRFQQDEFVVADRANQAKKLKSEY